MVTFELSGGGCRVVVNGKPFGFISRPHGFFTDPTVVREFMEVSSDDLRKIALRSEVERGFVTCSSCGNQARLVNHMLNHIQYRCSNCGTCRTIQSSDIN